MDYKWGNSICCTAWANSIPQCFFVASSLSRKLLQQGRPIYFDEKYFKLFLAIAPQQLLLGTAAHRVTSNGDNCNIFPLWAISTFLRSTQHHHGFLPKIRLLLGAKKGDKNNCLKTAPHHFYILALRGQPSFNEIVTQAGKKNSGISRINIFWQFRLDLLKTGINSKLFYTFVPKGKLSALAPGHERKEKPMIKKKLFSFVC